MFEFLLGVSIGLLLSALIVYQIEVRARRS